MNRKKDFISLPEEDYLAILDLINKFNECDSREDLKSVMLSSLLPLFNSQAALYGSIDPDFLNFTLVDSINMSEQEKNAIVNFIPFDSLSTQVVEKARPVMAYDVDIPRDKILVDQAEFVANNPDDSDSAKSYFKKFKTGLVMRDPLDPNQGIGIHRHIDEPLTRRDVRVLELLTPHILNTIKTIVLKEELSKYQSLGNVLADVPTPIALVRDSSQIMFCNQAFEKFFNLKTGQRLTEELTLVLKKDISRYEPPFDSHDSKIEIPFIKLKTEYYRLHVTRIERNKSQEGNHWLLRIKPAIEPYSKLNILMQEVGLTGREMEIAILVRDGMGDQEIADRLFLSVHTVKNHLKSIHKKLNVQTRAKLVALLNQKLET